MPVESAADRAAFISAADFGEVLSWTVGVVTSPVPGIPSTGALRLDQQDGPGMVGRQAALLCALEAVPVSAGLGNSVSFRGFPHTVKSLEPDGTGMVLVRLEEVLED